MKQNPIRQVVFPILAALIWGTAFVAQDVCADTIGTFTLQIVECDPEQTHFLYHTWHCSAYERRLCDRGLCYFTPMIFRNLAWYYRQFLTVNVAMACVTPMDRHGYFNLSAATGVSRAILEQADIVILEINEHLPRLRGGFDEVIHISDADMIVEGAHAPFSDPPEHPASAEDTAIANLLLPHICDGATVQRRFVSTPASCSSRYASEQSSVCMPRSCRPERARSFPSTVGMPPMPSSSDKGLFPSGVMNTSVCVVSTAKDGVLSS